MRDLQALTPPGGRAVGPRDLDAHLRLDGDSAEMERADRLSAGVVSGLEGRGLTVLRTRYAYTVDALDLLLGGRIDLPRRPVASVISVTQIESDNGPTEAALVQGQGYTVSGDTVTVAPGALAYGSRVRVEFEAGYGPSIEEAGPEHVPPAIREAILRQTATLYEHREDAVVGTSVDRLDHLSASLLAPYLPVSV